MVTFKQSLINAGETGYPISQSKKIQVAFQQDNKEGIASYEERLKEGREQEIRIKEYEVKLAEYNAKKKDYDDWNYGYDLAQRGAFDFHMNKIQIKGCGEFYQIGGTKKFKIEQECNDLNDGRNLCSRCKELEDE